MALIEMQKPKKNSPPTTLSAGITSAVTTIPVTELSVFYDADSNLITSGIVIGFDSDTETAPEEITIAGASATSGAGNLTGATRGVNADGTIGAAAAWDSGANIAVMLTSTGIEAIEDNITSMNTPKRTILLSGAGGWASTTDGSDGATQIELPTNDVDIVGVSFPSSALAAYHQYHMVMPLNYDGGTITAQFFWTTDDATPTGDVSWKIQGQSYANDDPLDAAWGTAVEVVDTIIAKDDLHVSTISGAVTIANTPAGGDVVAFRVYRDGADASDTSANDVLLLGVLISYGTDNYSDV